MHKRYRRIALILALATVIGLCGCTQERETPTQPVRPTEILHEKADNTIGARYTFSLSRLTEMLNEGIAEQDRQTETLSNSGWKLLSAEMVDDSGVQYSSYYYQLGTVTFTAAVENESREVLNIGCGCDTDRLEDREYKSGYLRLAAIIARMAGGYTKEDTGFLEDLCTALLDGEDTALYYENALYIKSEDDSTVLLMVSPSDAVTAAKQEIRSYYPISNNAE